MAFDFSQAMISNAGIIRRWIDPLIYIQEDNVNQGNNCCTDPVEKPINYAALSAAKAAFLAVSGMGCQSCAMRIRNSLLKLDGVLMADVVVSRHMAAVAYDPQQVEIADLLEAVATAANDGRHNYQAQFIKEIPAIQALG